MKLTLIKLGKAWSVLKRDGFLAGSRRIMKALSAFTASIPAGDILLISGGVGDSARYRTKNVAEELNFNGFRASFTMQDHPFLESTVERFKIIVFHRVLYTEKIARYVARAKALGRTILFETDDLVYDPQYLHLMDYYTKMNALEKKLYENGVGGELLADPYITHCTTTTTFLKRKLEERGKTVFLVTNKLSEEDVEWAKELREAKKRASAKETVCISYLSGTPSHNKDFATITPALVKILEDYPHSRLVLAGPLDTETELHRFANQIIRVPFAPRKEYFQTVASADINVAPLELGNDFCEAKSELKFFEAAIVGVPTVAVKNETYRGAIEDGHTGFLAANPEEWYEKLRALIENPELRATMAKNATQAVLERYTTSTGKSKEYYQFLRTLLHNNYE